MKHPFILKAVGLASLLTATSAFSQGEPEPTWGTVSNFTLSLNVSKAVDALKAKGEDGKVLTGDAASIRDSNTWSNDNGEYTETGVKIQTSKYSIKEFLLDLVESEVIEDIAGWTVKKIQTEEAEALFFLYKKVRGEVSIIYLGDSEDTIINYSDYASAEGEASKRFDPADEEASSKVSYTGTYKFAGDLDFDFGEKEISLYGILTMSEKFVAATATKPAYVVPGAGKLTSLSGEISEDEVVEGTASFSAGVLSDISDYAVAYQEATTPPPPAP